MRLPLFLTLFLLAWQGAPAFAQEQDRTLAERISKPDTTKSYDFRQSSFANKSPVGTGEARSKGFAYDQKVAPKDYSTREFAGSKPSWLARLGFGGTKAAGTTGKYQIPNSSKQVDSKSAPVRSAFESDKAMASRQLPGGNRPYLGPEKDKMNKSISAETMADWRLGSNTVTSGKTVERYSDLKELSIDDVREILNKNK